MAEVAPPPPLPPLQPPLTQLTPVDLRAFVWSSPALHATASPSLVHLVTRRDLLAVEFCRRSTARLRCFTLGAANIRGTVTDTGPRLVLVVC